MGGFVKNDGEWTGKVEIRTRTKAVKVISGKNPVHQIIQEKVRFTISRRDLLKHPATLILFPPSQN